MSGSRPVGRFLGYAGVLALGVVIGGYLFADTQPRSFLAVHHCEHCLAPKELLGLLGSAGIQRAPGLMPLRVLETDRTIVIEDPFPQAPVHLVILPKRDIRNVGELSDDDRAYLIDAFAVIGSLIRSRHLRDYTVITNGPGYQDVAYLHFHLLGGRFDRRAVIPRPR